MYEHLSISDFFESSFAFVISRPSWFVQALVRPYSCPVVVGHEQYHAPNKFHPLLVIELTDRLDILQVPRRWVNKVGVPLQMDITSIAKSSNSAWDASQVISAER